MSCDCVDSRDLSFARIAKTDQVNDPGLDNRNVEAFCDRPGRLFGISDCVGSRQFRGAQTFRPVC